jgi:hypothetical protein
MSGEREDGGDLKKAVQAGVEKLRKRTTAST